MVDNGSDMLEKPLMGTIVNVVDVVSWRPAEIAPASRDDCSDSRRRDCFEHLGTERFWIVHHYTAETDVDRRRPALEERLELGRRSVAGRFAEEEATDI